MRAWRLIGVSEIIGRSVVDCGRVASTQISIEISEEDLLESLPQIWPRPESRGKVS